MGIKANFTKEDVRARFDAFLEEIQRKQIARLQRLGEMCLIEARTNKGYMMQTGALLSSTGYQVFVDGVAVHSQFDAASGAQSDAAAKGVKTGQELAEKIGTNKSYISRVETGKTEPKVSTFYRIASALGLNVELTPAM